MSESNEPRKIDTLDVLVILAILTTSAGAGMIYLPAGLICFGLLMLTVVMLAIWSRLPRRGGK